MGTGGDYSEKSQYKITCSCQSPIAHNLNRFGEIEENDDRRISDGCVMAGEDQAARFAIHAEYGDVVAALITAVKEPASEVEIKTSRIVPERPFLPDVCQDAGGGADGKDRDAVV